MPRDNGAPVGEHEPLGETASDFAVELVELAAALARAKMRVHRRLRGREPPRTRAQAPKLLIGFRSVEPVQNDCLVVTVRTKPLDFPVVIVGLLVRDENHWTMTDLMIGRRRVLWSEIGCGGLADWPAHQLCDWRLRHQEQITAKIYNHGPEARIFEGVWIVQEEHHG